MRLNGVTVGYVDRIVEAFGGVRVMARAVGKPKSTVGSWADRGSIPDEHKSEVLQAAQGLGLDIGPADFFPFKSDCEEDAA